MRLKSLKLAGFKSFANPTTFTFRHGITAIVGPNGCGKSNVIDAIRWVLGETSAKQLRGGAMSDVIFAGTQDKAAKSVASVELTFEHTQDEQTGIRHEFNLYQELSVRRQVNLDGRSDYFINGTRCRRRDVVDVFLGTGLGARSYAVIEQGMIGRIVESSPMQLREFIEEAAGVSRYQARREETQKKLEKTKENLARLYDMQSELERQKKTLSKQATSAERYQELTKDLADIQQQLAIQQLYQAKHTQQQHKTEHERSTKAMMTLQADYEQLKVKQDKLAAHINQEQWLKDDAQSTFYQQQLSYQQAEQQLNNGQVQLTHIEQQLLAVEQQRQHSLAEIDKLQTQQAQQQATLKNLQPQLVELNAKRKAHTHDEQASKQLWQQIQKQLTLLQDEASKLNQQQALNTQSQNRYQLSQDKWMRRQQNWQVLWEQSQDSEDASSVTESNSTHMNSASNKVQAQIIEINTRLTALNKQKDSVEERLFELQPQALILQQQLTQQQSAITEYEKRHALMSGEYDTLHQILHPKPSKELNDKQAPNITADKANKDKLKNDYKQLAITTLREQIELSLQGQQYAQLLDSLLAIWLDSHVFTARKGNVLSSSQTAANSSSELLHYLPELLTYQNQQDSVKNDIKHSLWLPAATQPDAQNHKPVGMSVEALPAEFKDKIFPLTQLIARPALALWQQCYLYIVHHDDKHNIEKTEALAAVLKLLPSAALLFTSDGWLISKYGTINLSKFAGVSDGQGDSQNNSKFLTQRLQQRKRLDELESLLNDCDINVQTQQQAIKKTQYDYDALMISIEETRAQAQQITRDHYQYQQQLTTQQAAYQRIQDDEQRLNVDKAALAEELKELEQEKAYLDDEQQKTLHAIEAVAPKLAEVRATAQRMQAEHSELSRTRQADEAAWQSLQLTIQQNEIRLEHSVSSLEHASVLQDKSLKNEQALTISLTKYQQQLPELERTLQAAQTARDAQQVLLTSREAALTTLKHEYTQQQSVLDTVQTELQSKQSKLANVATELALSEQRLEDASSHAQDALSLYYKIDNEQTQPPMSVSSLLTDFIAHERRVRPDRINELQHQQTQLEKQLSKIGAVNLAAVAELSAVNERLAPLAQQTEDIATSMDTLSDAIAAIDETTKTLFIQTLEAVNADFSDLFAKVFGGGHASLSLNVDELPVNTLKSEHWRAGLTLMAQPKGKRNSRLAVLSGGEKTLTALSLIFAIFKQHPAPFCVLDEVDAPLDDANVARFTSLIHELAGDLQFIFISHNKLAMQIADELKGITMPSAGISTLVSVSLDEATSYIES